MNTAPALLTIGTCNHRAGIAAVVESFVKHHPVAEIFICLVDRPPETAPTLDLPGEIFYADQLDLPGGKRFLFKYDAFELCCALKPFALFHVMKHHEIAKLLYLDSDILVLKPFWEDLEAAWSAGSILLTPHLVQLPLELSISSQRSIVQHGAYNGGLVAVREDSVSKQFLTCWANLLSAHCTIDPMNNIYVDQRWLDLLAASSAGVRALRDPGLNVAYWNLHERRLDLNTCGQWTVNDRPLKFFHFSGFDRNKLSTKVESHDHDVLILSEQYGQILDAARDCEFRNSPYGWGSYDDGKPILPAHRDLILGEVIEFGEIADPFTLSTALSWETIDAKAKSYAPLRVGPEYLESRASTAALIRLRRHPVVGLIWKLWERLINPSLSANCPPHVRS